MPIFITNILIPLALSVIRFYLYNPSKKYDGQILDTVKQSVAYLANGTTTNVNSIQSISLNSTRVIPQQFSDIKGGL